MGLASDIEPAIDRAKSRQRVDHLGDLTTGVVVVGEDQHVSVEPAVEVLHLRRGQVVERARRPRSRAARARSGPTSNRATGRARRSRDLRATARSPWRSRSCPRASARSALTVATAESHGVATTTRSHVRGVLVRATVDGALAAQREAVARCSRRARRRANRARRRNRHSRAEPRRRDRPVRCHPECLLSPSSSSENRSLEVR